MPSIRRLALALLVTQLLPACQDDPTRVGGPTDPFESLEVRYRPEAIAPGDTVDLRLDGAHSAFRVDDIVWTANGGTWLDRTGREARWIAPDLARNYGLSVWVSRGATTRRLDRVLPVGTEFGVLFVDSSPSDAEILLDGLPTGRQTPFTFYHQPAGARRVTLRLAHRLPSPRSAEAHVAPDRPASLAFVLVPFGTLSVLTRFAGTAIAVPGATVDAAGRTVISDSLGVAAFDSLELGTYRVSVAKDLFETALRRVRLGEGTTELPVGLESPALTRAVSGVVRNTRGGGIAGGQVVLLDPDGEPSRVSGAVAADGRYTVRSVPMGGRAFQAGAAGYTTLVDSAQVGPGDIRLDWTLPAETILPPGEINLIPYDPDVILVVWRGLQVPTAETVEILKKGPGDPGDVSLGFVPASVDSFFDTGNTGGETLRYALRVWNLDGRAGPLSSPRFARAPFPMQPVWAFPTQGRDPSGVAFVDGAIWTLDARASEVAVTIADHNGTLLGSRTLPGVAYRGLHWDGSHLWAVRKSSSGPGIIEQIDIRTTPMSLIAQGRTTSRNPEAIVSDGTSLWVCDPITGFLYRHEILPPFAVVDSVPSPGGSPYGLAWDGARLWSCDSPLNRIYRHGAAPADVERVYPSPGGQPRGLTFDGSGHLWTVILAGPLLFRHARP